MPHFDETNGHLSTWNSERFDGTAGLSISIGPGGVRTELDDFFTLDQKRVLALIQDLCDWVKEEREKAFWAHYDVDLGLDQEQQAAAQAMHDMYVNDTGELNEATRR